MPPLIRNTLIRFAGFLSQIWRGFKTVLAKIFGFLARIFGLTTTPVSLEGDDARSYQLQNSANPAIAQSDQPASPATSASSAETTSSPKYVAQGSRRRPDPTLDHFRKMARETAANRYNAGGSGN
jgi:hypothetical protein